jgi:Protein of unknown function (DUF935)
MFRPLIRNLGTAISRLWTGARGRAAALFSRSRGDLSLEKVRGAVGGLGILHYLARSDGATEETPEIRAEYRRMLRDETVKAALLGKVDEVAALDWQLHAARPHDPRSRRVADFCGWNCERSDTGKPGLIHSLLLHGLIEGNSICEKVWDLDPVRWGEWEGKYRIRALKAKPPAMAQLAVDTYLNVVAIRGGGWNAGRLYDPTDFVIFSNCPLWENPQGMSDLRAAYRAYLIKDVAWKLRAIYLEKYSAGGMMKGKYARNELKAALVAALEDAKAGTYVALPDGTDVDLLNLATRGTADFEAALHDLDKAILVGITGAFLQATEGTVSQGRGSSKVHKRTSDVGKWKLAAAAALLLSTQLFPDLTRVNFGADEEPPWLTLGAVDDEEMQPALAIDRGLWEMGLGLSKKELYHRYARSEPHDDEDLLAAPPQAPPGPGGAPPRLPFAEETPAAGVPAAGPFQREGS